MSKTRDPDRLVAFTDGVVAIAVTLLILPLVDVVQESKSAGLTAVETITEHRPQIFSFLLSFVVIAAFWLDHHRLFEHVRAYTSGLMRLNLLWLLTIVVLPFPTAIIGQFDSSRFTAGFYTGTILALSACETALTSVISGHDDVENPGQPGHPGGVGRLLRDDRVDPARLPPGGLRSRSELLCVVPALPVARRDAGMEARTGQLRPAQKAHWCSVLRSAG